MHSFLILELYFVSVSLTQSPSLHWFLDPGFGTVRSRSQPTGLQRPIRLACFDNEANSLSRKQHQAFDSLRIIWHMCSNLETDYTVCNCNSHLARFMASDELCFSTGSITNQTLDDGGRDSLTITQGLYASTFSQSAIQVHSRCGNHSDQCKCSPNHLKGLRLSASTTGRREPVSVCYLCGCIVAHCGGVILQVAGRLTLLERKTVKSKMDRWRAFSSVTPSNPRTRNETQDQPEPWNFWSSKSQT